MGEMLDYHRPVSFVSADDMIACDLYDDDNS